MTKGNLNVSIKKQPANATVSRRRSKYKKRADKGSMLITRANQGPIALRKNVTFKWISPFSMGTLAGSSGVPVGVTYSTVSLFSLFKPYVYSYVPTAMNQEPVDYFKDFIGTSVDANRYQNYRVNSIDVVVKVISTTPNTYPKVAVCVSPNGFSSFDTGRLIQEYATRPMTLSRQLESFGDHSQATFTFKIKPWEVLQISKREYYDSGDYIFNASTIHTTPKAQGYMYIISGDGLGAVATATLACAVAGSISLKYHTTLLKNTLIETD